MIFMLLLKAYFRYGCALRCVALRGERYRDADSVSIFWFTITAIVIPLSNQNGDEYSMRAACKWLMSRDVSGGQN